MSLAFVDTNVLVHAADEATPIPEKTRQARDLLCHRGLHISVQVLNEFTANARHPHKLNLSPSVEWEWVQRWLLFPIQPLTTDCYLLARLFHERYQVSHWDGLILAAAKVANCEILYSEDLNTSQFYDQIQVINPFDRPQ